MYLKYDTLPHLRETAGPEARRKHPAALGTTVGPWHGAGRAVYLGHVEFVRTGWTHVSIQKGVTTCYFYSHVELVASSSTCSTYLIEFLGRTMTPLTKLKEVAGQGTIRETKPPRAPKAFHAPFRLDQLIQTLGDMEPMDIVLTQRFSK